MKKIVLKSISIRNFKGLSRLELTFSDGVTSIFGKNASGKTAVADAFFWLLFDKDTSGRADFNIKQLNSSGEVADHSAIVEVEAVIDTDGTEKVFKKTLAEKWSTRRGSENKVFDGNETERFINGLPMKKYEYDEAVAEIADEQVFRTVTSVTYFSQTLSKTERRRILFDMTSTLTDKELMAKEERFSVLLPHLDKLGTVDNIKAAKQRERRALNEKRSGIPIRIDELTHRTEALAGVDFGSIEAALKEAEVSTELAREKVVNVKNFSYPNELDNDIKLLESELKAIEAENREYRASITVPDISALKSVAAAEKLRLTDLGKNLDYIRGQMNRLRDEFNVVAKRDIAPERVCPTCGREYDTESIEAATAKLKELKDAELAEINKRGLELKEQEAEYTAEYEQQLKRCEQAENDVKAAEALPPVCDMDGYEAKKIPLCALMEKKKAEKEKHINDFSGMLKEAEDEFAACVAEEKRLKEALSTRGIVAECERRIGELKEEAKTIAADIEDVDEILITADDFVRFKVSVIEDSINSLFGLVRFKLFNEQINGGLSECCEATVDGVPYADLNTASKVNAGLDIINAVSEYYGISAPVFVDNAESVTELMVGSGQLVRLVVSEEDERIRVA